MKPVTAIVIGAGCRGYSYALYSLDFPNRLKIVGVADPQPFYRKKIQKAHNISTDRVYSSWEEVAAVGKFADCVFICTPDILHKDAAVAFARLGYAILLEKPMAVTYRDCLEIVQICEESHTLLAVCHVLRYSPQARKIKELIEAGVIGEVSNIQLLEPVGFWHFAHSFVRGNWRNIKGSTFSLLSKSCHDLDLICYWMAKSKCKRISSFGSLQHFRTDKKPEGSSSRCWDCKMESDCPYSAKKIYLEPVSQGYHDFPVKVITEVVDIENVTEAIKSGPYGRCVYDCDNDVCDNQVVNLQFEDGATASFTMVAFTEKMCERQVRIFGTMGELTCDFENLSVHQYDFRTRKRVEHIPTMTPSAEESQLCGHGSADFYTLDAFVTALLTNNPSAVTTGPQESLRSHLLTFAAERSRLENKVIENPMEVMNSGDV